MSNNLLGRYPVNLNIFWINKRIRVLAQAVNYEDTLFDVLSRLENQLGIHHGPDSDSTLQHSRAFLTNKPISIAPNEVVASIVEKLGNLEMNCREWPRLDVAGKMFSLPLDNRLLHVILDSHPRTIMCASVGTQVTSEDQDDEIVLTANSDLDNKIEGPSHSRYPDVPHEILLQIFSFLVVPSKLLNFEFVITSDVHERITVQKGSLLLVCKGWYNVAVETFYRDVSLLSVPQSLQFIESLETSSDAGRQLLVKNLTIHALAPPVEEPMSASIVNVIRRIFHLCTNLSKLSFFPIADRDGLIVSSDIELDYSPVLPSALFPSHFHLRELCLGSDALHYLSDYFIHCSHSLEVLELWIASSAVSPALSVQDLEWPRLKWLRCCFYQSENSVEHIRSIEFARSFKTTKLESLTLSWAPWLVGTRTENPFPVSSFIPLIEANRSQLRYLCIVGFRDWQSKRGSGIATILERAPRLEHLVVDARLFSDPAPGIHPSLEYIDIWGGCSVTGEDAGRVESGGITLEIDETKFPSLKNIRMFDKALLATAAYADLPSIIPQGKQEYRYPEFIDIAATSDGKLVYRNDVPRLDDRWDWENFTGYYKEEYNHPESPRPWFYRGWAQLGEEADSEELYSSGSEYVPPESETDSAYEYEYASSSNDFYE
ncbi:hypothetical protein AAF712_010827 [Marasmius tenuissimus]|uniref:F-box domain-containing protein n=1 Tax=Marasmius tenuissimus TaxID=585030 RepID=A0ABR2ZNN0_9AGAR